MLKNNNFLICLTGLPASGKTTFAKTLKMILERRFTNLSVSIVDPDIIRHSLDPRKFDYNLEPIVKEQNLAEIKSELSKGSIVISDNLNYYSSMRHDLKILADNFKINFFIIYIATPVETCLKWNKNRGEPIPNEIISKIQTKFDDFGKYKWDYPIATIDLSQTRDLNNRIDKIVDELINNLSSLQKKFHKEDMLENSSNWDNQNLDKITRIYVGKLLQNPKLKPMKKKIIELRKLFVKHHKNKALKEKEIAVVFKEYLERSLMVKINKDFLK